MGSIPHSPEKERIFRKRADADVLSDWRWLEKKHKTVLRRHPTLHQCLSWGCVFMVGTKSKTLLGGLECAPSPFSLGAVDQKVYATTSGIQGIIPLYMAGLSLRSLFCCKTKQFTEGNRKASTTVGLFWSVPPFSHALRFWPSDLLGRLLYWQMKSSDFFLAGPLRK